MYLLFRQRLSRITRSRRVASQGGRNLLRQRLQLEDGETGFISSQRGGFDDARKLKTMCTKYNQI